MTKELEIEFKNMLTRKEYDQLLEHFGYTEADAKTQVNHYFDTADFALKSSKCALRIRKKHNGFECTLKTPAPKGNYETTDLLNERQAQEFIEGVSHEAPEVCEALQTLNVAPAQLKMIGKLTTHRIEFDFQSGLLVLDHSEYGETMDYELEFEVADAQIGEQQFTEFLQQRQIPLRPADKKIARFMKSAKPKH
ncbi:CYTH domain-containing protein [Planococcus sp. N064]|uniref:CYTH domain-containing protein n=1 Tax=Planococcus liqunii TaxID=3058394 RepID=A0ABT8MMR7_9BACL|nr:CYTH domain-containing protein [Planococcus sp. N064]MDN7226163.1 CYTH domain-containing protein [Planococcus sp. N064]